MKIVKKQMTNYEISINEDELKIFKKSLEKCIRGKRMSFEEWTMVDDFLMLLNGEEICKLKPIF